MKGPNEKKNKIKVSVFHDFSQVGLDRMSLW